MVCMREESGLRSTNWVRVVCCCVGDWELRGRVLPFLRFPSGIPLFYLLLVSQWIILVVKWIVSNGPVQDYWGACDCVVCCDESFVCVTSLVYVCMCVCVCVCVRVCVCAHVVNTGHVFRSSRVGTTVANRGWNDEALQSRRTLSASGTAGLHSSHVVP